MKTYKIDTTRIDQYKVEIDPSIITSDYLHEWSKSFSDVDEQEFCENLTFQVMIRGVGQFLEGYGRVKTYQENSDGSRRLVGQYKEGFKELEEEDYALGIVLVVIAEEEIFEYETELQTTN